ncbi:hypothetical protein BACOVA_00001, partial [Bacteroides ovatus ATCC 8483]
MSFIRIRSIKERRRFFCYLYLHTIGLHAVPYGHL